MTHAYSELYLDDAMNNLGDMVDYALCDLGFEADHFFGWFISSGVASRFEKGNPKYVAGMSGVELADHVLYLTNVNYKKTEPTPKNYKSKEFWAGWILAYYQWYSRTRFEDIVKGGLSLSKVLSMYILHEADESKFVEAAEKILKRHAGNKKSRLHEIRKARGFTQKQLSEASGVSLRMIQLYEQKQNDISKAQVNVVINLAKTLGCDIEDLIE